MFVVIFTGLQKNSIKNTHNILYTCIYNILNNKCEAMRTQINVAFVCGLYKLNVTLSTFVCMYISINRIYHLQSYITKSHT